LKTRIIFDQRLVNQKGERGKEYMRKVGLLITILLVITCSDGCAVIGRGKDFRPFEENALTQVTPGKTTAGEVMKLFGAPSQIVKLSNGNAYVYERSLSKATGFWLLFVTLANYDTQYDRIVFFVNRDDVVSHYGSSFKTGTGSYGFPF
jgi:hypothetical protein